MIRVARAQSNEQNPSHHNFTLAGALSILNDGIASQTAVSLHRLSAIIDTSTLCLVMVRGRTRSHSPSGSASYSAVPSTLLSSVTSLAIEVVADIAVGFASGRPRASSDTLWKFGTESTRRLKIPRDAIRSSRDRGLRGGSVESGSAGEAGGRLSVC